MRIRAWLWLLLAAGVLVSCSVLFASRSPLQTNLLALLPPTERNPVAELAVSRLADAAGNRVVFLLGHASAESAKAAAHRFATDLGASGAFRQVTAEIPVIDPKQLSALYLQHRYTLLSENDRSALLAGAADLEGRLRRKLYAPFRFGLTSSAADDPFGLTDAVLAALPLSSLKLEPNDGLLIAQGQDPAAAGLAKKTYVFISAELRGSAYDSDIQQGLTVAVAKAEANLTAAYPDSELLRTGTAFYASAARETAEREVDIIGAGSLIGMLLLMYAVFRSLRPLALGLVSVAFGIGAGVLATVLVYGEIHLITLVFGASLIGEAIDYAIQYFAAHLGAGVEWEPMAGLRRIARGLTVALGTSLLGYGALMLAPFPALSQIALFAMVGLTAAWLSVFLLLPALLTRPTHRDPDAAVVLPRRFLLGWQRRITPRAAIIIAVILLLSAVPGWLMVRGDDDVRLLISRPPQLLAQEERIRALTGFGNSSQFFLVEGSSVEALLVNEESLTARLAGMVARGEISGYQGVSAFVPSAQQQEESRGLWAKYIFADQDALRALLAREGFRDEVATKLIADHDASTTTLLTLEDWLKAPISMPFRHLWLGPTAHGYAAVVLPQGARQSSRLASVGELRGVTFVDKAGSVSRLFHDFRLWGSVWLAGALCLVYGLLRLRYGWRDGAVVAAPTLLALLLTPAVFGYLGAPLTLFHLMALVLVLGVGVNYAIFLHEGGVRLAATLAGVALSAATTLLSFGLLAFSSMAALSGFGATLMVGVGIAVLLAPMVLSFCPKEGL